MSNNSDDNFAKDLLSALARMLSPLTDAVSSPESFASFTRRLGWSVDDLMAAPSDLISLASAIGQLVEDVEDEANITVLIEDVYDVLTQLEALRDLVSDSSFTTPYDNPEFWRSLPEDIFGLLLCEGTKNEAPGIYGFLSIAGVFSEEYIAEDATTGRNNYTAYRVEPQAIVQFFASPAAALTETFAWGSSEFKCDKLINALENIFAGMRSIAVSRRLPMTALPSFISTDNPDAPYAKQLVVLPPIMPPGDLSLLVKPTLVISPAPPENSPSSPFEGIVISPTISGSAGTSIGIPNDDGPVTLRLHGDFQSEFLRVGVWPDGVKILETETDIDIGAEISINPEEPIHLLGSADKSRIELSEAHMGFNVSGDPSSPVLEIFIGSDDAQAVIDPGDGDGLLKNILKDNVLEITLNSELLWSSENGLSFSGGVSPAISIPINDTIFNILYIEQIDASLATDPDDDNTAIGKVTTNGSLTLGPLFLGFEELGIRINATTKSMDNPGNFGTLDISFGLNLPTGYAASLDLSPIEGGGALFKEENEYRGALALRFQDFAFSAFGILTTELPDGEEGFSFLASLFGEFNIALGYGFFLTGLGGLIGINRTTHIEELQTVLSEGRLDNLLFPNNPIEDASTILEDMANIFPAKEGQYLAGPMAKIGWGVPTLIEGKVGVIIELGAEIRLIILGSVGTALPTPNSALVVLNVDFLGTIDFDIGAISFDATLMGSRILTWGVSGEMALRTGWGQSSGLVLSTGGLHPQYPTPSNFPDLQRLTINFGSNNPSLTLTAYMAVTLNSIQAGAEISLYAKGPKIPLIGQAEVEGWAGFDALIMFNPFEFDASLSIGLKLFIDGDTICGIGGDLRLKGPNSYYISGKVWVTVLGVDVNVPIEHRWGEKVSQDTQTADGVAVLQGAIENSQGWEPIGSSTRVSGVTFNIEDSDESKSLIDPTGGLRFSQNAIPLNTTIEKIGNAELVGDYNTFDLAISDADNKTVDVDHATGEFIKGHYFELSETEKLRTAAAESYKSGVQFDSGNDVLFDSNQAEDLDYEYETIFLDDDEEELTENTLLLNTITRLKDSNTDWYNKTLATSTTPLNNQFIHSALVSDTITVSAGTYAAVTETVVSDVATVATIDNTKLTGQFADMKTMAVDDLRVVRTYLAAV